MSNRKYNIDSFINKANKIHNFKYDYSDSVFLAINKKIEILCPVHERFFQLAINHLKGRGCYSCGQLKAAQTRKKQKADCFIERAFKIHGSKYDYSEIKYIKATIQIKIICPIHGLFSMSPNQHLQGRGCKPCGIKKRAKLKNCSWESFLSRSKISHNDKFEYLQESFKNLSSRVKIKCPFHGFFVQKAKDHIVGKGCLKCGYKSRAQKKTISLKSFIDRSSIIHNNKYNYSQVRYKKGREKVKISCPLHGVFLQTPEGHLSGRGCKRCVGFISHQETSWLDYIGLPNDYLHRNVTLKINYGKVRVDGFVLKTKTVYEFYGDYWHGNPSKYKKTDINKSTKKTFGQLYKDTIAREDAIKQAGYKIISIWEKDWKLQNLSR